jgi:hypothetical protein
MNSQALQKRIIDGKLFSHGPIGEWACDDFRRSLEDGTEENLSTGATDTHRTEYPASNVPGHRIRNWGSGSRLREG